MNTTPTTTGIAIRLGGCVRALDKPSSWLCKMPGTMGGCNMLMQTKCHAQREIQAVLKASVAEVTVDCVNRASVAEQLKGDRCLCKEVQYKCPFHTCSSLHYGCAEQRILYKHSLLNG